MKLVDTSLTSSHRLHQNAMSIAVLTMAILLICVTRQVQGGCSRFGHSCFGAHGKRADLPTNFETSQSNYDLQQGYIQPPGYISLPNANNARISPYVIDWIMATHRGDMKSAERPQEDAQPLEMRKK